MCQWHSDEVGHSHACYHQGHGLHFASGACEFSRHDGSDSEVGAMGQSRDETCYEEGVVSWGGCCQDVADANGGGQQNHYAAQWKTAYAEQCQCAEAYAGCIG